MRRKREGRGHKEAAQSPNSLKVAVRTKGEYGAGF
jgi:hypothetical protein